MGWKVRTNLESNVINNYKNAGVSELLASVLINRGITSQAANTILTEPRMLLLDPFGLVNMYQAVKEVIQAIENGDEIWVNADYDADGMTSGFSLSDFLKTTTNNDVFPYYPNRSEGYGLSMNFCKEMVSRREEIGKNIFVITVDNGVACVEQVNYLNEQGIGILVTDHHMPKGELPNCTIVNPQIVEDNSYKHLCGCGVALKLIEAIAKTVGISDEYVEKYYYVTAIGTIADMMPLTVENMAMIRLGMNQLNSNDCPYVFKLWKKFLGKKQLTPMDIGWEIGPRLNACGRMESSDLGGVLLAYKEDTPAEEVNDTLLEIEDLNQERKALTDKAKKEIEKNDYSNDLICMFDASAYPGGIAGIIAGKLLESTGKPAIVYSGVDIYTGSIRSPHGLDIQPVLEIEYQKGNLITYGGHAEAAGLSFSMEKLYDLQESLNDTMASLITFGPKEEKDIEVDAIITLSDVNMNNYYDLQQFSYDKDVFTTPVFALQNLEIVSTKLSNNNPKNICLSVKDSDGKTKVIWAWGYGDIYKSLGEPEQVNLIGNIDLNFMDKRSATLRIVAMEAA